MLEITCAGTPYQIGHQHGQKVADLVKGSLAFYGEVFQEMSKMDWDAATCEAAKFMPYLEKHVPHLVEEMKGVADGAGVSLLSILALNARTEISMGMMTDGCTSIGWRTKDFSLAGQNWDWKVAQKERLILLHIKGDPSAQPPRPSISQITEAGIIGKIGVNSAGVGVFLNAICSAGISFEAIPVHLGLRVALEANSRIEGLERVKQLRFGSAGHVMLADKDATTSLEFTSTDVVQLEMNEDGWITHSNHFLVDHPQNIGKVVDLEDSVPRQARASELLAKAAADWAQTREHEGPSPDQTLWGILEDELEFPISINRKSSPGNVWETLFSIIVDLRDGTAVVKLGRPTEPEGTWSMKPAEL